MINLVLRIVLLPWEFLLLTWDFLRTTGWLIRKAAVTLISGKRSFRDAPPCSPGSDEWVIPQGKKLWLCGLASRYRNPFLARLLCPKIERMEIPGKGVVCLCGRGGMAKVSGPRYALAGVLLLVAWGSLLVGGLYAAGITPRRIMARLSRTPTSPDAVAGIEGNLERTRAFIKRAEELMTEKKHMAARIEYKNAMQSTPTSVEALVGLARCDLEIGFNDEAQMALERAIMIDKNFVDAYRLLAELMRDRGDHDVALKHAAKVRELKPDDAGARLLMASCMEAEGDLDGAAAVVAEAVALDPKDPAAKCAEGSIELKKGNLDRAGAAYEKALELSASSAEARLGLARVSRVKGDADGAIRHLEALLAGQPKHIDALIELADIHVSRGNWSSAIELLKRVTKDDPKLYVLRGRLAGLQILTGNVNEGYLTATELLKENPEDIAAHLILADLFLRRGLASIAVDHCKKVLSINGRIIRAHKLLARGFLEQRDFEKAIKTLEFLLTAIPEDIETHAWLAACLDMKGDSDEAVKALERAVAMNPNSPLPYLQMGAVLQKAGKGRAAEEAYRKVLEMVPDQPIALNNLANLLLDRGMKESAALQEAYEIAVKAREKMPANAAIADTLGWIQYHRKDYDAALELLQEARRTLPSEPTVRYHLAAVLIAKGEHQQAQVELEEAFVISSSFPEADEARKLMKK